jgi:2-oxoglutaroyl-CoA hydrolase
MRACGSSCCGQPASIFPRAAISRGFCKRRRNRFQNWRGIALPEQRLGQIPGSGGSARLQKIIGITRTKDIVMRSKRITARQAYDWGIATECVPDGKLEAATDALVEELRSFSSLAQRTAKALLNATEDTNLAAAIELEGHCYSRLRQSDDFREGVEAFHAKRKPNFRGT